MQTKTLLLTAAVASVLASAGVGGGAGAAATTLSAEPREPGPPRLLTAEAGGSGSTVGPDGALYVTDGAEGRVLRVDPKTGAVTTFTSGLPRSIVGVGGAMDVAFKGGTAYVLVTLVGSDVGGSDVVGVYRVDSPTSSTVVADIGAFSLSHPPSTDFFVPTGVQYALQKFRGGFLVTDGHHNRVLRVRLDGTVSELIAFGNVVPTGLAAHGKTIYMAEAGPVPHLPEDGRVVRFQPGSSVATEVASGGRLLVDVEFGRGRSLFALAQGVFPVGNPEGSPAAPDTGQLLTVNRDGTFDVVADGLDRPTSFEIIRNTAYVITFDGEIWTIAGVSGKRHASKHGGQPSKRRAVVLPPGLDVKGKSLVEWQRALFRWTSRISTDGPRPHPALTEGEVDCSYGQRGRVWFLEAGGVERGCSIPFGKIVYVPVNFWFCLPEADGIPFPACEAEGDAYLAASNSSLTVDGRRLDMRPWRTDAGRFTLKLADANIWEFFFGSDLGPTTEISSDGMGALVLLGPGTHTIVAGSSFDFDGDGVPETSETTHEIRIATDRGRR
jgi:hypothetical protein